MRPRSKTARGPWATESQPLNSEVGSEEARHDTSRKGISNALWNLLGSILLAVAAAVLVVISIPKMVVDVVKFIATRGEYNPNSKAQNKRRKAEQDYRYIQEQVRELPESIHPKYVQRTMTLIECAADIGEPDRRYGALRIIAVSLPDAFTYYSLHERIIRLFMENDECTLSHTESLRATLSEKLTSDDVVLQNWPTIRAFLKTSERAGKS